MTSILFKNVHLKIPVLDSSKRIFQKNNNSFSTKLIGSNKINEKNKIYSHILKNINFSINSGDSVAIIGHNGSGKSSLLRLISKIYYPTEGEILIKGRVNSFLNIGSILELEASGYQNIEIINRTLKNYKFNNKIINKKIEEISDLGNFLHMPIKNYSEGMKARLIFSIITLIPAEILLIDEGIYTGDENFKNKSKKILNKYLSKNNIKVFASHDLDFVEKNCNKCFVLKKGEVKIFNNIREGIIFYKSKHYNK